MFRLSLFIFFFILFFGNYASAQNSVSNFMSKHVTNYAENEYGEGFNAQNWSITQDKDGLMYFGNSNFVLTYDGIHWGSIPISTKSGYVTSLLANKNGNIYWGYDGDLGVIETNSNGKQNSRSLLDKIPEMDRYFSRVWRIFSYKSKIVFFTQESIFIYNPQNDSVEVFYPEESFHLAFVSNDELYVRDRAYGLEKFNGTEFQKIIGGDVFHNEGIFGIIPISNDRQIIVTQLIGLYIFDPKNTDQPISKLNSPDTEILNEQQIIGSTLLHDGNIALNTASNGVIVINENGRIIHRINLASGIADNDVKQVYQDNYNNLWLATNNGISLVNYSSPISLFLHSDKSGLYGSVNALEIVQNRLFIGTTTGLFTYANTNNKVFEQIKGLSKNITALCTVNEQLFIGTTDAVYVKSEQSIIKIASIDVSSILFSEINNRVFIIGKNGVVILQKNKNWGKVYENKDISISSIGSIIETDTNQNDNLWIGTISNGLFHLSVTNEFPIKITAESYNEDDNLPKTWVKPFIFKDNFYAGTNRGLYQLEDIHDEESDSIIVSIYKPFFIPTKLSILDSGITTFINNSNSNYFAVYNGAVGYIEDNSLNHNPFRSLDIGKINTILPKNDHTIWIGANGGLAHIDLNTPKNYQQKPDIKIRSLKLNKDSVLFYKPSENTSYNLNYKYNSIKITYSSLYNENGKKPLFSYKLYNYDNEWSEWTTQSTANYKKLKEGNYTFKIKAKNIYDIESDISQISFSISAPWYRTIWAYILYLVLGIGIIISIVKLYTYRLKQKNIQLEAIIEERTKEIVEQKDEIELQRDLIEEVHQEIKSSIEYARRIQTAVLPHQEFNQNIIKDYFILFKPKDVVSGDFYWAKQNGDHLIIAVADCTGHGVPGAFMSMLGVSLLNEIVGKIHLTNAGLILDELREGVIYSLKQNENNDYSTNVMDGMDISLVSVNLKSGELQWAGAHNPLFIISDNEVEISQNSNYKIHKENGTNKVLYDIKADKMPIAISGRMTPFVNHKIKLNAGDTIYMFSDGYIDQFGGPKGKKFMIKAFRTMLLSQSELPMKVQMQHYDEQLTKWITYLDSESQLPNPQVDDICLMGIKF